MAVLWDQFKYSLYVMTHPFDGFWDLKHEKRGSIKAGNIILILLIITLMMKRQLTGFLFNPNDPLTFNPFVEIGNVYLPFIMWCVSNWCLTTLMDGEGSFKDIYMASAYAMMPMIVINLFTLIISHFLNSDTAALYYLLNTIAVIWMGALLFFGLIVVHQYSFGKALLTAVFIIVGIAIIIFISLMFFKVVENITQFIASLVYEIKINL